MDRKRKLKLIAVKERIEGLVVEALDSGEATPMTDIDWENIRQTVRNNVAQKSSYTND